MTLPAINTHTWHEHSSPRRAQRPHSAYKAGFRVFPIRFSVISLGRDGEELWAPLLPQVSSSNLGERRRFRFRTVSRRAVTYALQGIKSHLLLTQLAITISNRVAVAGRAPFSTGLIAIGNCRGVHDETRTPHSCTGEAVAVSSLASFLWRKLLRNSASLECRFCFIDGPCMMLPQKEGVMNMFSGNCPLRGLFLRQVGDLCDCQ